MQPKAAEPLGDCAPDPTQPDDSHPRVAHLTRQRVHPVDRPPARPHVPVRRRELPHHVDHQPDCGVRNAVGQHVGRIADGDATLCRGVHIGRVVADPEVHDRAERRQRRHQTRVDARAPRRHHRRDLAAVRGQKRRTLVGFVGQHIGRIVVLKGLRQRRLQRPDLKDGPAVRAARRSTHRQTTVRRCRLSVSVLTSRRASRRAGHHRFGQLAAAADSAHQRHPAVAAGGDLPRRRHHQLADHPLRLGRLEKSISDIVGVLTPTQSNLVYLAYGIAILALPFAILIGLIAAQAVEAARRVRGGGRHRPARAVGAAGRLRCAAMALRPGRPAEDLPVAVPRRPALDRHARRDAHGVGAVAARAVAALVVGAAAGLRAHPSRRQRRGARSLTARPGGGLVRRRVGGAGRRHAGAGGAARRRRAGDGPAGMHGDRADGGATGRTRIAASLRRVRRRARSPRSRCTARISAAAGRCASCGGSSPCAAARPRRSTPRCAASSSTAR